MWDGAEAICSRHEDRSSCIVTIITIWACVTTSSCLAKSYGFHDSDVQYARLCIFISMSIDVYLSHLSCVSIGLNLEVLSHDNHKYLMLLVASGCYDPLGADDRAGGRALPS